MFKFLKDKLKKAVNKFSKEVEEESEVIEIPTEEHEETAQKIIEEVKEDIQAEAQDDSAQEIVDDIVKETEPIEIIYEDESNEKTFLGKVKDTFLGSKEELNKEHVEEEVKKAEDKLEEEKEEIKDEVKEAEELLEEKPKIKKEKELPEQKAQELLKEARQVETQIEAEEEECLNEQKETWDKEKEILKEKPKGFFGKIKEKITKTQLSEDKFEDLFQDLEIVLLENNVAFEVVEKIKEDLKNELTAEKISRMGIDEIIKITLKKSISELFDVPKINLIEEIKKKEGPYIIAFVGINGAGKTTSAAKVAKKLMNNNFEVVLAAADTFRVAAIEQLEHHANKLGVKMIKHDYGSDPAAVCFDAIEHAKSKSKDVVLIDTAGRSNANANLMDELKKVIKVAKPDLVIFVGDALTGNDAVEQAQEFDNAVGINAIILTKSDADEKGGCAISISHITKKPIIYFGTGQNYEDLSDFSSEIVLNNIGI